MAVCGHSLFRSGLSVQARTRTARLASLSNGNNLFSSSASTRPRSSALSSSSPRVPVQLQEQHQHQHQHRHRQQQPWPLRQPFSSQASLSSRPPASATTAVHFDDTRAAFRSKSLLDIVRALLVFRACSIQQVVKHAEAVYKSAEKMLGRGVVSSFVKPSFFRHFCAGEDELEIAPTIAHLHACGVGGILDYAAEADVPGAGADPGGDSGGVSDGVAGDWRGSDGTSIVNQPARTYAYTTEAQCDANLDVFLNCIRAVHNTSPEGFAAVKLTALGSPELLQQLSTAIVETRALFRRFDTKGRGVLSRSDFHRSFQDIFVGIDAAEVDALFELYSDGEGMVDYVSWSKHMRIDDLPKLVAQCREAGPLTQATLDARQLALVHNMRERLLALASEAQRLGVRLMIDAEQTYFQPAIDNLVIELQQRFNDPRRGATMPVIFNTYQMYLRDALFRLRADVQRSQREGYFFAAKLVRGAYMVSERRLADDQGRESPVHATLEDTHDAYNDGVRYCIRHAQPLGGNVMLATHNQASIERAIELMHDQEICPRDGGVYFGQLLGMADHLTFSLGSAGYKAYKYVPYGAVHEVMPYLIRRVQENSDIMGGVAHERALLWAEFKRRLVGA